MSSFGCNAAPDGRDINNRMFTVEGCPSGESPVTPRKRLHSAEDARCSSRPPPEGAGSVSISESEEKGGFCQQCQKKVIELKKQALTLADQNSLKYQLSIVYKSPAILAVLGNSLLGLTVHTPN
ncbi:Kinesin-like protein KIF26A [Collichthys lucidus]|uniref:Kinesin-like protein KIF26A n=1 Tax=Collichthys lucidus TaxID=240159 RepID=A0A4U5VEN3_COLLU|nr:Kinesin-like protein KIF26A [Collichthys lucidus]